MKDSKITEKVRLQHIAEAIEHIEVFIKDITEEQFMVDILIQAAVERKLEIIGEASNHLSYELTQKYPEMEWAKLKAFRNIIAHEYFGISQKLIWESVKNRIPELKQIVIELLSNSK